MQQRDWDDAGEEDGEGGEDDSEERGAAALGGGECATLLVDAAEAQFA